MFEKKLKKLFGGMLLRPLPVLSDKYEKRGLKKLKGLLGGKKPLSVDETGLLKNELKNRIKMFAENASFESPIDHFGNIIDLFEQYDKTHGANIIAESFKDYLNYYGPEYFNKQLKENFDSFTITCKQVINSVPIRQMAEVFTVYAGCLSKINKDSDIEKRLEALKYCLESASMQYDYFKTIDKKEILYPMIEKVFENLSTTPEILDDYLKEFPKDTLNDFMNERAMEVSAEKKDVCAIKYLIEKGAKPCEVEGLETSSEIKNTIENYSKIYEEAQELSQKTTEKNLESNKEL